MKKIFLLKLPLLLLFISLLISCDKKRVYEKNETLPETGWKSEDVRKFEVDIKDPSSATNFFVNVRNADGYPYSNLYLFIKTVFPDGKLANDTLECMLSDDKGNWLGSGMGDIYDNRILFKSNVKFPMAGKYVFEMGHGMRTETLPLIMDVGFRIEKSE